MVIQLLIALSLSAAAVGRAAPGTAADAQLLAIVAGKDFPVLKLSARDARRIYLGEKLFVKGVRVRPMEPKDEALKVVFYARLMNMTAEKFKLLWLQRVFQDGVEPPGSQPSAQMLSDIRENPGRVGYLRLKDAAAEPELIILLVVSAP